MLPLRNVGDEASASVSLLCLQKQAVSGVTCQLTGHRLCQATASQTLSRKPAVDCQRIPLRCVPQIPSVTIGRASSREKAKGWVGGWPGAGAEAHSSPRHGAGHSGQADPGVRLAADLSHPPAANLATAEASQGPAL